MPNAQDFIEAYISAFEAGDAAAMLALYADEIRAFDAAEPAEYTNKEAWTERVETLLEAFDGERRCEFTDIEILETDEISVVVANVALVGDLAGTEEQVELLLRATFVLGDFDGELLVAHEHVSVPLTSDDLEDQWTEEDEAMFQEAMQDFARFEERGGQQLLGDQQDLAVEGEGHRGGLLGDSDGDGPTETSGGLTAGDSKAERRPDSTD